MPLYDYECKACRRVVEVVVKLSELDFQQTCRMCSKPMQRLMSAPNIQMDLPGYNCPVSGKWVEGRAAHRANLAKHGCRVLEAGEKTQAEKRRAEADKQLEDKMATTMARAVEALPQDKKQRLCQEMERGASVTVERQ